MKEKNGLLNKTKFAQTSSTPKGYFFLIMNIFEIAQIVFFRFSDVWCEHPNRMELPTDVNLHFLLSDYEELSFPLFLK